MTDAPTLIFLHLPKTGGSTLRQIFGAQYREDELFVLQPRWDPATSPYLAYLRGEQGVPWRIQAGAVPQVRVRSELSELPPERMVALRALVGHFWFGIHEALGQPATYVTILRDPVERVLSLFHYHLSQGRLRGTIEEFLDAGRGFDADNGQTRRLCGPLEDADVRVAPCTEDMLDRAKRNLREHFSVVGLTERFDESVRLMARMYGWRAPPYEPVNVTPDRPRGRKVSRRIRARIAERNRFDLELHRFAEDLLKERLRAEGLEWPVARLRLG